MIRVFKYTVGLKERWRHNLWLNLQFSRKRNVHIYITICVSLNEKKSKIYLRLRRFPDLPTVFGTSLTSLPMPRFTWILPHMQKYFANHWSIQIFFTSGISPVILMKVLEDCILFLIWTAWVLFKFYFKQEQQFSVWIFTENASLIYFHVGI